MGRMLRMLMDRGGWIGWLGEICMQMNACLTDDSLAEMVNHSNSRFTLDQGHCR